MLHLLLLVNILNSTDILKLSLKIVLYISHLLNLSIFLNDKSIEILLSFILTDISNSSFVQFQVWDLPGHIDFFDATFDAVKIFGGCGALIFVIDAQVTHTHTHTHKCSLSPLFFFIPPLTYNLSNVWKSFLLQYWTNKNIEKMNHFFIITTNFIETSMAYIHIGSDYFLKKLH